MTERLCRAHHNPMCRGTFVPRNELSGRLSRRVDCEACAKLGRQRRSTANVAWQREYQKTYRQAHKEKRNTYMEEYRKKRKSTQKIVRQRQPTKESFTASDLMRLPVHKFERAFEDIIFFRKTLSKTESERC